MQKIIIIFISIFLFSSVAVSESPLEPVVEKWQDTIPYKVSYLKEWQSNGYLRLSYENNIFFVRFLTNPNKERWAFIISRNESIDKTTFLQYWEWDNQKEKYINIFSVKQYQTQSGSPSSNREKFIITRMCLYPLIINNNKYFLSCWRKGTTNNINFFAISIDVGGNTTLPKFLQIIELRKNYVSEMVFGPPKPQLPVFKKLIQPGVFLPDPLNANQG